MFVLKSGISQRPPVPWPDEVLDVVVHFPYVLVLQRKSLQVYSMLDQQLKQTVFLNSSKSLQSTTGSILTPGLIRLAKNVIECNIRAIWWLASLPHTSRFRVQSSQGFPLGSLVSPTVQRHVIVLLLLSLN